MPNLTPSSTPCKEFEAWFQEIPFVGRPANNIWFAKEAWLAGCRWQREQDSDIALHLGILADHEKQCCGEIPEQVLRAEIADAIQNQ